MTVRRVAAVAVLLLLSWLPTGSPAQAAAKAASIKAASVKVMSFNICGNVCRQGEVAHTAGNIAYQIRAHGVAVALLQEVCYSQFLGVQKRLARYGYSAQFGRGGSGRHCDDADHTHGVGFGIAIVARGHLTAPTVTTLPSPYGVNQERRVLLTAQLRLPGRRLVVATAHTAPGGPNLAAQLTFLQRKLAPVAAHHAVIFGGDLNALPDNSGLDGLYAMFAEANRTRVNPLPTFRTVPRKIDYLFARRLTPLGAAVATTGYSDHRMYFGVFA
jgi:endonuclease/exonuclease/phosphatase family metal-dependent hydrolase